MHATAPIPAIDLLIFPFNGNGQEALDCVGSAYRVLGFVDDAPGARSRSYPFDVMTCRAFAAWPAAAVLAVPGSPDTYLQRRTIIEGLGLAPARFARVVHPSARVSPFATLGRNVLIMAGAVVTANAVIGDHVCILPNTVVHHDVVIGAWSLVGSNVTLAGHVHLGENCYVGSGTSIKNHVSVGAGSLVGLGSNVTRDVPAAVRVAGNPAVVLGAHLRSL